MGEFWGEGSGSPELQHVIQLCQSYYNVLNRHDEHNKDSFRYTVFGINIFLAAYTLNMLHGDDIPAR